MIEADKSQKGAGSVTLLVFFPQGYNIREEFSFIGLFVSKAFSKPGGVQWFLIGLLYLIHEEKI